MNKKIENNLEKYKNCKLVKVYIQRIPKNIGKTEFITPGIGGSFAISIMVYTISSFNRVIRGDNDGSARFWYTDKQLATRKFSSDDVKLAIKAVLQKKVGFNPFSVFYIDLLDQLYPKKTKKPKSVKKTKSVKD